MYIHTRVRVHPLKYIQQRCVRIYKYIYIHTYPYKKTPQTPIKTHQHAGSSANACRPARVAPHLPCHRLPWSNEGLICLTGARSRSQWKRSLSRGVGRGCVDGCVWFGIYIQCMHVRACILRQSIRQSSHPPSDRGVISSERKRVVEPALASLSVAA